MLDPRELAKFIPEDPDGIIESDLPQPTPPKKKAIDRPVKRTISESPWDGEHVYGDGGDYESVVKDIADGALRMTLDPADNLVFPSPDFNDMVREIIVGDGWDTKFDVEKMIGDVLAIVQKMAARRDTMSRRELEAHGGSQTDWMRAMLAGDEPVHKQFPESRDPEYRRVEKKLEENEKKFIAALADELTDDPVVFEMPFEAVTKKGSHLLSGKGNKYDEFKPDAGEFDDKSKHNTPCDKKDKPGKSWEPKTNPGEGGKGGAKAGAAASAVPELKKVGKEPLKKKGEPTKSREPGIPGTGSQKYKAKGGPSESASKGGVIGFKSPDIIASVNGAPTDSEVDNLEEAWLHGSWHPDHPTPDWERERHANFSRDPVVDTPPMSKERMLERGLDPDSGDIADAGAVGAIVGSEHSLEDPGWAEAEPETEFDTSRVGPGGMRLPSPDRPDYEEYDELSDASSRVIDTPRGPRRVNFLRSPGPDPTRDLPQNIEDYDLTPEEMDEIEALVPGWAERVGSAESDSPLPRPSPNDAFRLRREPKFDFDTLTKMDSKEKKGQKAISEGIGAFDDEGFEDPVDELLKPTPMSARHIAWLQANMPDQAEDDEDVLSGADLLPVDELDRINVRRTLAAGEIDDIYDDKKRGKALQEWEEEFAGETNPTSGSMQDAIDAATRALQPSATAFPGIADVIAFIQKRFPQYDAHEVVNAAIHNK